MNRFAKALAAVAITVSLAAPVAANAQATKIGFVNTERILRDSKFAVESQKKLEKDFAKRQKDLEDTAAKVRAEAAKLDKDSITLSEAEKTKRQRDLSEMDRDFQRKRREFDEDLAQRKSQVVGELVERANRIIRSIAEKEGYDIIFQEAVYANKRIDITDQVLTALDSGK
ncbi:MULTISPECIES: OmpH family outer membrane protein [Limnobacter]|uniref:Outer membrane protein chaperone n=1 Tax=Limnobacter litoralis TaxID=481366 RepID=A0ABQ5YQD6_9BURK|nr:MULTISPECIES: OmpH family outer membrane protein [Limnobacter]GLR26324.1 outer membrane protein chaperone [Limnobacter litoralis]HEX5484365.1 OmpH family outer membrane protein [Limnobacter sp.]